MNETTGTPPDTLTARERLHRETTWGAVTTAATYDAAAAEANRLIDAYAHELAQKLRAAIAGFDLDDHWAVYYPAEQVQALPDLIDPEAQQ